MELLESLELIGPGRWLDRPVMDQWLQLEAAELQSLEQQPQACLDRLLDLLRSHHVEPVARQFLQTDSKPVDPTRLAAQWLGETAVLLQRWAGHRVDWVSALPRQTSGRVRAIFEFEDLATGRQAASLALEILNLALALPPGIVANESLAERVEAFRVRACERIFPVDAEVMMAAAEELDIPVCKLDREPYEPIVGDFRIRKNGLLRFGHACHQQVVDGTLCLQRSAQTLQQFGQPSAALNLLRSKGLPVGSPNTSLPCPGESNWHFLCAGQQLLAVVDNNGNEVTEQCDISWLEAAAAIAQQLEVGMLVLTGTGLSQGLRSGGFFTGVDISPELDQLIEPFGELHRMMAGDFVRWMFPDQQQSRIPIFSVTGTNGKTTICRMLRSMASQAGFRVGLACTDGVYLNNEQVAIGDSSGGNGHHLVLESRDINLAVLETARGAVLHSGFAFDHSDVAICSNITPEHLGEYGITDTRQMAAIKLLIVNRARKSVVLNFDDDLCRELAREVTVPRLCWTSTTRNAGEMGSHGVRADMLLCLEKYDGNDWIVCHSNGSSRQLMPVNAIPACFDGAALHNVSNAMQAIATAMEMGIAWDAIHPAMSAFAMGVENTPGRLNLYRGLPFLVLLDFVQNLDGMKALCQFVETRKIRGRRILVFSVLGRHDNTTVKEIARYAVAHFDRFICRNFAKTYPHRTLEEIPNLLQTTLLEFGVPPEHVQVVIAEEPAIDAALRMARPGDLVTLMCGLRAKENWQQISEFAAENVQYP